MEKLGSTILCILFLCCPAALPAVHCSYYSSSIAHVPIKEKKTNLRFFLHDMLGGVKPSAVMVANSSLFPVSDNNPTPFGSTFVIDDPLTEGPDPTSKVIGNARGAYVSANRDSKDLTLLMLVDFGFTTGKFNGSSFSVFSRNPVAEEADREVAVVGGRGKFRMARGFAKVKTQFFNYTNGDAVLEYHVTLLHYY